MAQQLTGWQQEHAHGMELHQVFVLANNFGQHSLLKSMAAIYAGSSVIKVGNQSLRNRNGQPTRWNTRPTRSARRKTRYRAPCWCSAM
jgi:uncharacterized protein YbdZ (MbtH family)